ncbi:hypothetical protein OG21DRAFT_1520151 [Imleria badia]|nr:hypothetical protein OG21DRAFT_1520151 [Imleria badia]
MPATRMAFNGQTASTVTLRVGTRYSTLALQYHYQETLEVEGLWAGEALDSQRENELLRCRGYFAPTGEELQGLELLNRLVEAVPTPVYMIQLDDHPGYTVADAHLTKHNRLDRPDSAEHTPFSSMASVKDPATLGTNNPVTVFKARVSSQT